MSGVPNFEQEILNIMTLLLQRVAGVVKVFDITETIKKFMLLRDILTTYSTNISHSTFIYIFSILYSINKKLEDDHLSLEIADLYYD